MNNSLNAGFVNGLVLELQSYLRLCEEILSLATRENQALSSPAEYLSAEFHQQRKDLLPDIESLSDQLRQRRIAWVQVPAAERERCDEVKQLFQDIQNMLMKVLLLDRENQQAMLRRGLIPAEHLPAPAEQKPNYVANLYRQHSPS